MKKIYLMLISLTFAALILLTGSNAFCVNVPCPDKYDGATWLWRADFLFCGAKWDDVNREKVYKNPKYAEYIDKACEVENVDQLQEVVKLATGGKDESREWAKDKIDLDKFLKGKSGLYPHNPDNYSDDFNFKIHADIAWEAVCRVGMIKKNNNGSIDKKFRIKDGIWQERNCANAPCAHNILEDDENWVDVAECEDTDCGSYDTESHARFVGLDKDAYTPTDYLWSDMYNGNPEFDESLVFNGDMDGKSKSYGAANGNNWATKRPPGCHLKNDNCYTVKRIVIKNDITLNRPIKATEWHGNVGESINMPVDAEGEPLYPKGSYPWIIEIHGKNDSNTQVVTVGDPAVGSVVENTPRPTLPKILRDPTADFDKFKLEGNLHYLFYLNGQHGLSASNLHFISDIAVFGNKYYFGITNRRFENNIYEFKSSESADCSYPYGIVPSFGGFNIVEKNIFNCALPTSATSWWVRQNVIKGSNFDIKNRVSFYGNSFDRPLASDEPGLLEFYDARKLHDSDKQVANVNWVKSLTAEQLEALDPQGEEVKDVHSSYWTCTKHFDSPDCYNVWFKGPKDIETFEVFKDGKLLDIFCPPEQHPLKIVGEDVKCSAEVSVLENDDSNDDTVYYILWISAEDQNNYFGGGIDIVSHGKSANGAPVGNIIGVDYKNIDLRDVSDESENVLRDNELTALRDFKGLLNREGAYYLQRYCEDRSTSKEDWSGCPDHCVLSDAAAANVMTCLKNEGCTYLSFYKNYGAERLPSICNGFTDLRSDKQWWTYKLQTTYESCKTKICSDADINECTGNLFGDGATYLQPGREVLACTMANACVGWDVEKSGVRKPLVWNLPGDGHYNKGDFDDMELRCKRVSADDIAKYVENAAPSNSSTATANSIECEGNEIFNSWTRKCEAIHCQAGYEAENHVCVLKECLGTLEYKNGDVCETCPSGQRPNADKTGCENIVCAEGMYLDGFACVTIPTDPKVCPDNFVSDDDDECVECAGDERAIDDVCEKIECDPNTEKEIAIGHKCVPITCPEGQVAVERVCVDGGDIDPNTDCPYGADIYGLCIDGPETADGGSKGCSLVEGGSFSLETFLPHLVLLLTIGIARARSRKRSK